MSDPAITLDKVSKRFGGVQAVYETSVDIEEGEFFSILGPSGCGKTTTLRMIAGFEDPDEGRILLRGVDVTRRPPNHREVNMVFQHYALFPHMDVFRNVAFGLNLKGVPKDEQRARVLDILSMVRLEGMERRRPIQLSGGQQQRVALARALVNRPAALLLDEPLGALDVKLRKQMQLELKRIQSELGTTFVYVTHDQEEALAMSDRIAIMNEGRVEQIGSPRDVYERPETAFVADFVGVLNALEFRTDQIEGGMAVMRVSGDERIVLAHASPRLGEQLTVAVRPEQIRIAPDGLPAPEGGSRLRGEVAQVVYLGTVTQFHVGTSLGSRVLSHRLNDEAISTLQPGQKVMLTWSPEHTSLLGGASSEDEPSSQASN